MNSYNEDKERRSSDAELMREVAYDAVLATLQSGEMSHSDAVIALRHAYHRAERHARGFGANAPIQAPPLGQPASFTAEAI
jgi:hypothetical protein